MPTDVDVTVERDKAEEKLTQLRADLEVLQVEARSINEANAERAALHAQIREVKRDITVKAEEYGELARTVALSLGGTNYRPLP